MTTTGQLLVSLSGLPSGSALAHLMAITTGTGTGETIYAHRTLVVTEQRAMSVTNRAKRTAQPASEPVAPINSAQKQGSKYAYAFTKDAAITVLTSDDEAFILDKVSSSSVVTKDDAVNISRRRI